MRSKKIIATLLLVTLTFSVVGCSDSNNTETKTTAGSEKDTIETTSNEEIETTSTEETTSAEEVETTSNTSSISQHYTEVKRNLRNYDFISDYQDIVINTLNNREFCAEDIIDVKSEIEKAGYSVEEYGKVFSFIYTIFTQTYGKYNIEAIDSTFDDDNLLFLVDNNNNFVFKVLYDCKVEVRFENNSFFIKIYSDQFKDN